MFTGPGSDSIVRHGIFLSRRCDVIMGKRSHRPSHVLVILPLCLVNRSESVDAITQRRRDEHHSRHFVAVMGAGLVLKASRAVAMATMWGVGP